MDSCFTEDISRSVASLSEGGLIRRFCANLAPFVPPSPFGSGDDCSLIEKNKFSGNILATCDPVILGRHFEVATPARLAGKKLLNRNISDIASMGGVPKLALVSCIISPKISLEWLDLFCMGLREAAEPFNVNFVGGDVSRGPEDFFSASLTLLGEVKAPLLRSGAKVGDKIFVTGALGASFESGRHLDFAPKVREGLFLAKSTCATSCTDVSDGLASDLRDILNPAISAKLKADSIPVFKFAGNNLKKALCDGEDYELLFTLDASADKAVFLREFERELGYLAFEIGEIIPRADSDILIESDGELRALKAEGFSHF